MKKQTDPRMHTAEQILNQTMDKLFKCGRCFNAHIEKKKSKCDYRFDRELTRQELEEIQTRVNQVLADDLPVTEEHLARAEAIRKYNTDKLPENAGDTLRIVHIGDYDACPCIGTHVNSTAEIPGFKITSAGFDNQVLRIRFKLESPDEAYKRSQNPI